MEVLAVTVAVGDPLPEAVFVAMLVAVMPEAALPFAALTVAAFVVVLIVAAETPLLADAAAHPAAVIPSVRIMRLAVKALTALVKFMFKMNTPFLMNGFSIFIMTGQRVGSMKA